MCEFVNNSQVSYTLLCEGFTYTRLSHSGDDNNNIILRMLVQCSITCILFINIRYGKPNKIGTYILLYNINGYYNSAISCAGRPRERGDNKNDNYYHRGLHAHRLCTRVCVRYYNIMYRNDSTEEKRIIISWCVSFGSSSSSRIFIVVSL